MILEAVKDYGRNNTQLLFQQDKEKGIDRQGNDFDNGKLAMDILKPSNNEDNIMERKRTR